MPGSRTGTLPGWQDGGKPAARGARLAGLPSLIGLGARPRSCRRDTWEERGGRLGPSFKARVCFPGAGGREPQKAARGPRPVSVGSGQLREAGQAWPGSGIPVGAGRGGTVPVPAVRPELPEELLLRWLNPLAGKPGTPRLSSPRGCGGIPNGWSRQPRDQAAPQNWVSADGSRPPPPPSIAGSISIPKRGYRSTSSHRSRCFQENPPGEERSSSPRGGGVPGSRCSPAHFLGIWTLAYSEPASSG